jgi:Glyoxalase-like domain
MTSEPHRRAIGSLRAVALDAPDIDHLATFYEQLAAWRRVPDDDDEWITLDTGDGWRIGLQRATDHVPPDWSDQSRPQQAHLDFRVPGHRRGGGTRPATRRHPAAPQRAVAHTGRSGRSSVRPLPQPGRSADHPDGRHARLP